jgi:hypothetical protein
VPPHQRGQPEQLTGRVRQAGGQRTVRRSAEQMFQTLDEGLVGNAGLGRAGSQQDSSTPAVQGGGDLPARRDLPAPDSPPMKMSCRSPARIAAQACSAAAVSARPTKTGAAGPAARAGPSLPDRHLSTLAGGQPGVDSQNWLQGPGGHGTRSGHDQDGRHA